MTIEEFIGDFYNKYNGKAVDTDGLGAQCVSLFKKYCEALGDPNWKRALGGDGYAWQIAKRFHANGYDKYFDLVGEPAKLGDVLVYAQTPETPLTHVSFFAGYAGNGKHYSWGQNQGGPNGASNTIPLSNGGVMAILRPKGFNVEKWNPKGIVKVGSTVRDPDCGVRGIVQQIDIPNNKALVLGCWLNCAELEVLEK